MSDLTARMTGELEIAAPPADAPGAKRRPARIIVRTDRTDAEIDAAIGHMRLTGLALHRAAERTYWTGAANAAALESAADEEDRKARGGR